MRKLGDNNVHNEAVMKYPHALLTLRIIKPGTRAARVLVPNNMIKAFISYIGNTEIIIAN